MFYEKKSFEDFFHEVEKPCVEISKENENCELIFLQITNLNEK